MEFTRHIEIAGCSYPIRFTDGYQESSGLFYLVHGPAGHVLMAIDLDSPVPELVYMHVAPSFFQQEGLQEQLSDIIMSHDM